MPGKNQQRNVASAGALLEIRGIQDSVENSVFSDRLGAAIGELIVKASEDSEDNG